MSKQLSLQACKEQGPSPAGESRTRPKLPVCLRGGRFASQLVKHILDLTADLVQSSSNTSRSAHRWARRKVSVVIDRCVASQPRNATLRRSNSYSHR